MPELIKKAIATEEPQDLELVASKDRDKLEVAGAVERSFAGEYPDTITENSTVPSMASSPSATTPPEQATAGILVCDAHVIHPWDGRVGLEPVVDENVLEALAAYGLPADAMRLALRTIRKKTCSPSVPTLRVGQSFLVFIDDEGVDPTTFRDEPSKILPRMSAYSSSQRARKRAPRIVNGKELRLRPWFLSIGWAQAGALPRWVFTAIEQLGATLFVHAPSRTPLAVWGPFTGPSRSGAPNQDPEAGQSETPPTEVEERDVRIVRELLTVHPMGSASLSSVERKLGVSPHDHQEVSRRSGCETGLCLLCAGD